MNVGIFLGTFNPPHIGHVSLVYEALDTKMVDKVIVVPAFRNPWKSRGLDTDNDWSLDREFYFRHDMCKAMFADLINGGKVIVSDIEYDIWRQDHKYDEDCVYSCETLGRISTQWRQVLDIKDEDGKNREKPKFILVTTSETLLTMDKWMNGNYIMATYPIMAMSTDTMDTDLLVKARSDKHADEIVESYAFWPIHDFKIHSTELRKRFVRGKTLFPFINRKTWEIITSKDNFAHVSKMYKNLVDSSNKNIN